MNRQLLTILVLLAMAVAPAGAVEETLQNDGFTTGAAVNFQAGFVAGEVAAARFVPTIACPCVVESVTLLFGGATGTRDMGVRIWEDAAGAPTPGALLFSADVSLAGSNTELQLIDLALTAVVVSGPFRVGLEFNHDGVPTVATDTDGSIDAAANFILADVGFPLWFSAASLGVSGDFVIRATIDNLLEPDTDADGIADSGDNCTNVANPDQRDTDGDNLGNACDGDIAPAPNDCFINFIDFAELSAAFFSTPAAGNWNPDADFNGDERVNFADVGIIRGQFFGPPGPSGLLDACD